MAVIISILWFLVLLFVSFFVASFACGPYILLLPFSVCSDCVTPATDFLLKGVQFPAYCAQAMLDG